MDQIEFKASHWSSQYDHCKNNKQDALNLNIKYSNIQYAFFLQGCYKINKFNIQL